MGKVNKVIEKVQKNTEPDTSLTEVVEILTTEERQQAAEQIADNAGVLVGEVASNSLKYGLIGTTIATLLGLSIVGISKLRQRRKQKNNANTKIQE